MADDTKTVLGTAAPTEIPIPDFEIKRCIGEGAFGRVFLALSNATGRYRAVKVVRRSDFERDRPYEMEFAGLKRFEEVSHEHQGFIDILHVSRNDQAGYFSYVMELADDVDSARAIDVPHYVPRTLAKELERRRRLPPTECVRVALPLVGALAELHRRDLVHRDVKPGNVVFIRGAPKLADIGLVTEAHGQPHTLIGTPDYMDTEVHGTPAGDLFAFGKLLYTMATGLPPRQWPALPEDYNESPDLPVLRELEAIWRKACQKDREHRYTEAAQIHNELLALQAGASVLRLKRLERGLGLLRRYGPALLVALLAVGAGLYFHAQQQNQAEELRQRKVGACVANGNHASETGDCLGALSWFAEAWRLDSQPENDFVHRVRLGSVLQRAPGLVQMWFQDRDVKEAYFAGQENQIVMSDATGRWQVYDLSSGEPLLRPFGMGLPDETVSLSCPTHTAVTAAKTNSIWLWDYRTGAKLRELPRPGEVLRRAAISPDGRWIAAAARTNGDEALLLWRSDADTDPVVLGRHVPGTHCLVFSPDSELLLSSGYDASAWVWDVGRRQLVSTFTNHQSMVFGGAFSPDSQSVATASYDRSARIWEARTGTEQARFHHDDAVWAAEFSPDGARLATAGLDFTARVWDVRTQACLQILRHNSKVLRTEFSPQGQLLLTSCFDGTVRVWKLPRPPVATPVDGWITLGGLGIILRTNGVWSLGDASGTRRSSLDLTNQLGLTFSFAPDDRFFAATWPVDSAMARVRRVRVFDAQTARAVGGSISVPLSCSHLAVSPGGRWVFAFNTNAGAVWNTLSGQRVGATSNGCHLASFSPDGKLLAVGRSNQVAILDSTRDFARLAGCAHPEGTEVSALQWDATGRRLITSCWDSSFTPLAARVWVARTGEPDGPQLEHRDGVLYATFSHDGTRAITCGEDLTAILWNPATGHHLPLPHHYQVFYAAFSEDDRLVATAVENRIAVWSADSGEPLTRVDLPLPARDPALFIRFTPDNRTLIIRDTLGSFRWNLPYYDRPREDLLQTARLLSAEQSDPTESMMPQSANALRNLWQKLRTKYPRDFRLPSE
jgi:WD40 repeat protein/serine/threonine protein kinase